MLVNCFLREWHDAQLYNDLLAQADRLRAEFEKNKHVVGRGPIATTFALINTFH